MLNNNINTNIKQLHRDADALFDQVVHNIARIADVIDSRQTPSSMLENYHKILNSAATKLSIVIDEIESIML